MSFLETLSRSFSWTSYLGEEICTSGLGRISPLLGAGSWTSVLDLKISWWLGTQGPTELDFIRRLSSESWDISTTVLGACCVLSRNFISSVTTWINKLLKIHDTFLSIRLLLFIMKTCESFVSIALDEFGKSLIGLFWDNLRTVCLMKRHGLELVFLSFCKSGELGWRFLLQGIVLTLLLELEKLSCKVMIRSLILGTEFSFGYAFWILFESLETVLLSCSSPDSVLLKQCKQS